MHKITGKQCMRARALLKWNIHDLVNRVKGMVPKRVDSFEHGSVHLMEWENDELVRAFKKRGIHFKADLDVVLETEGVDPERNLKIQGDGMHITIDNDMNMVSDGTNFATGSDTHGGPEEKPGPEKKETP